MLPFLWLSWWAYYSICLRFISKKALNFALILFFLEPTLLAQGAHVMPDLMLLCGFICSIYLMSRLKTGFQFRLALSLSLFLLCFSSMRGMIIAPLLFSMSLLDWEEMKFRRPSMLKNLRIILFPFVLNLALCIAWVLFHYKSSGWLFSNADSPWAENQGFAGLTGIMRNLALVAWRILDFGRLAIWIPLILLIAKQAIAGKNPLKQPALILFLPALIYWSLFLVLFNNPIAHRYLLGVFVLALPFAAEQIQSLLQSRRQLQAKLLKGLIIAILISGHFWIYPDKIAQGWDASLAHLPYFSLRAEFFEEHGELEACTDFPMNKSNRATQSDLNLPEHSWLQANNKWNSCDLVIYSNIINDIPESQYDEIMEKGNILKKVEKRGIKMLLIEKEKDKRP